MPYVTTVKKLGHAETQHYSVHPLTTHARHQQIDVLLDGQKYTLDWQQIATLAIDNQGHSHPGGRYSLLIGAKSYEVYVHCIQQPEENESQCYEIQLAGQSFEVVVEDERIRLLTGISRAGAGHDTARIQAPMPGLVVNTLVKPGDTVEAGQTVAVLEAMKMENDLPSPLTGHIKELRVQKGQTVDQGQILVIVERGQDA
jgi:biotin carboxyl carrier protein